MTDRLSQLQDQVNHLAGLFCDATGVLQGEAKPSKFENFAEGLKRDYEVTTTETPGGANQTIDAAAAAAAAATANNAETAAAAAPPIKSESEASVEDIKLTFAELIMSTAKKIDILIDSLPDEDESNEKIQLEQLKRLEEENELAAKELQYVTSCAEDLLKQVQTKLAQISDSQLRIHRQIKAADAVE